MKHKNNETPYLIDSHCHLDHRYFSNDGEENSVELLLNRARLNRVRGFLTVNCEIAKLQDCLDIANLYDDVWCSVGTHPHDAENLAEKAFTTDDIIKLSEHPKIIGIGETGLDYFYKNSPIDDQKENFRKHIHACQETGLPLIVHTRDADDDMIAILEEEMGNAPFTGVLHCFSSGRKLMEEAVGMGMYVSFSGIVTFNRSEELRDICKDVPLNRILVETDAPYLAPQAYRGKQNEPSYVTFTARKVAEIHGIDEESFYCQSTENFFKLFQKAHIE